jgi:lambda family phage portal protein
MGKRFRQPRRPGDSIETGQARDITATTLPRWQWSYSTGDKFDGGFGPTKILIPDYWTLRARSTQLFKTNIYARGIVRRLVTNEINTGLHLEATPDEALLGFAEDSLVGWAENVENRFQVWADNPRVCDVTERQTFGALQAVARMEALVAGDVLVTLVQGARAQLPRIKLINGAAVQTPLGMNPQRGNRIMHGVELDSLNRQVAYWVYQSDGTCKRLPAYGEKSGRRLAWLVYGTDKRLDDVRGEPLLALVLQSLKEIDRYRDSVQRKATVNSMLAMFIQKDADKPGTRPISGGAIRRGTDLAIDTTSETRRFAVAEHIPGLILDELQHGETPHGFPSNGTDEKFGDFEDAIVQGIAWHFEIPPEILKLSFSNNYSASQAAINEFKIYLNRVRNTFGEEFCQPIYTDWLVSELLMQRIEAKRLLESWRDSSMYDVFGAWTAADWCGQIKPSTDMLKQARGYELAVKHGWITNDRASRELTGTKFSKNVRKLKTENELIVAANSALAAAEAAAQAAKLSPTGKSDTEDGSASAKPPRRRLRSAAPKGLTA